MREAHMRRVFGAFVGALLLSALPAFAQAAAKPTADAAKSASQAKAKTMTANGTVSAVAADSLTVKGKSADLTFAVDASTKITATGASHKTEAMKDDKKPTQITDFVSNGDTVMVKYTDSGDRKLATSVTVKRKATVPK
jgi:Domain of unknown function (DUF5666)